MFNGHELDRHDSSIDMGDTLLPVTSTTCFKCVTRRSAKELVHSQYNKMVDRCLNEDQKEYQLALDTLSHPNLSIIPLDIDDLDKVKSAYPEVEDYDDIFWLLSSVAPEACLIKTKSGKWKGLLLVCNVFTWQEQLDFIHYNFSPKFISCLDLRERALRRVYLTSEALLDIRAWLTGNPELLNLTDVEEIRLTKNQISRQILDSLNTVDEVMEMPKRVVHEEGYKDSIKIYEGPLPVKLKSTNGMKILRFCLSLPAQALAGTLVISQRRMEDLFGMGQPAASRAIEALIQAGELSKTGSYLANVKACTYQLVGACSETAMNLLKDHKTKIPAEINDGEWFDEVTKMLYKFKDGKDFIMAVSGIKGSEQTGRLAKAIRQWNSYARKYNLNTI